MEYEAPKIEKVEGKVEPYGTLGAACCCILQE